MKWVVASDHAGVQLKKTLSSFLEKSGHTVQDEGTYSSNEPCDYPEAADKACTKLLNGSANMGILVCGTGIGVSMRANRYKGVRAPLIHNEFTAIAAKEHSNANILCFGERVTNEETALLCLKAFLSAKFEGGRHQKRIDKIDAPITNI